MRFSARKGIKKVLEQFKISFIFTRSRAPSGWTGSSHIRTPKIYSPTGSASTDGMAGITGAAGITGSTEKAAYKGAADTSTGTSG